MRAPARGLHPPITFIVTHQHGIKSSIGTWFIQVGLSWTYLISSTTVESVWDLSRGFVEVNFNRGIVEKLVKSKR